jgi:uncharacterized protein (UPF0218 family)
VWDAESATRVATTLGAPPDVRTLDARTRRRDRQLMALAQHKRQQSASE